MSRSLLWMGLGLALAVAAPVRAQDATGSGIVTESSRPIAGAAVLVDGKDTLFTDQDGKFTAPIDAAGDHKFSVALHGYQPLEQALKVEKDKAFVVDFALQPVLQIQSLTVPATLAQGAEGKAALTVKNTATSAYSIDGVGLSFQDAAGKDQTANVNVKPDAANPVAIQPGETATLNFGVTPTAAAAVGKMTVRASLFAFDTALGPYFAVREG